ncbi:MAG: ribosome small subunit-dependent GTPase A [Burkholderiales bacterium]
MPAASGTVVAGFGRESLVRADGGELLRATARSRQLQPVCGDRVMLTGIAGGRAVIEAIDPRRNVFSRASRHRTKMLAANVTQVVVLVACEPSFSDELVCRFLAAAELAGLPALIALNKTDLASLRDDALRALEPFRGLGYPLVELAAKRDAQPLLPYLHHHRSLLAGQSGMGKSTLVKTLVPEAEVHIGEISRFLDSGRQSTIASRLYSVDAASEIVDTPGVSEFGLAGLGARAIAQCFREFGPHAARCRFQDCRHLTEPGCAVREATLSGAVHPRRLALYQRIVQQELGAAEAR